MKKIFLYIALLGGCLMGMNSCELFGLPFAYGYQQQHGEPFVTLSTDAMTWLEAQSKGDFSLQYKAIMQAGLDTLYRKSEYSFFIMQDSYWDEYLTNFKYSAVENVPPQVMRNYLLATIVPGVYTSDNLPNPVYVMTLDGKTEMCISNAAVTDVTKSQNKTNMRAGWVTKGKVSNISTWTSNLKCKNGVMHVMQGRFK